jgi:hypothetical protein
LTAVSAICLLGLAIWFSKTEPLVALATVCYALLRCCIPFNFGGGILYFEALPLSSDRCRFASPLRLVWKQHRAAALCFFSFEGARNLLRFRLPCQPTSSTPSFPPIRLCRLRDFAVSRGGGFYHRRVRCQLRSLTSYFVFQTRSGAPVAVATSLSRSGGAASTTTALRVNRLRRPLLPAPSTPSPVRLRRFEGRGFYHRRVGSQHRPVDSVFRLSTSPEVPAASAASLFRPRGRGFYHHRVGSQPTSSPPSSRSRRSVTPSSLSKGRGYSLQPQSSDLHSDTGLVLLPRSSQALSLVEGSSTQEFHVPCEDRASEPQLSGR